MVALSLSLSACGGASLDPVAKAATNATSAGSEHVALTGSVTAGGQTVKMSGSGDFQTSPRLGAMHMQLVAAGKRIPMDEVMQGNTVYLKSPILAATLPAGKTWVTVDLRKAEKTLGVNLNQYAQQDPTNILTALRKAGSVQKVGGESVGGVETTHYRATIDFPKAKVRALPVDVWVDGDNLLRRMSMSYDSTSMRMDFSNYGKPVNVQVPSASETVDMTSLGG